jgi:uncharacterized membrane protein
LISAILCAVSAYFAHMLLNMVMPSLFATVLAIVIAAIIYITSLLLLRTFKGYELEMLPKGKKIVTLLEKCKLIR